VTGEPALYLGRRRNSYVEGLPRAESDALLDTLWSFIDSPQFIYEHRWRVGDLVVWDNRSTMHRRDQFDNTSRRVMHRTQIKGKTQPRAYVSTSGGAAAVA
jgi:taurine dioxygenase